MTSTYLLKYKDIPVLKFSTQYKKVEIINKQYLPINFINKQPITIESIEIFCSNRMLMTNREYFKEIVSSAGLNK